MPLDEEPKNLEIRVCDQVSFDDLSAMHRTGLTGETLAVAANTWSAHVDVEGETITHASSEGRPSEGESDTLPCSTRFVAFQRQRGENWWSEPVRVKVKERPWVDSEAVDQRNLRAPKLQMQVERAMVGKERYSKWATERHIVLPSGMSPLGAAEFLVEAIGKKAVDSPPSPDVVLLLDALRVPWMALPDVVREARRLYDTSNYKGKFRAIYVVPFADSFISRLDAPE